MDANGAGGFAQVHQPLPYLSNIDFADGRGPRSGTPWVEWNFTGTVGGAEGTARAPSAWELAQVNTNQLYVSKQYTGTPPLTDPDGADSLAG